MFDSVGRNIDAEAGKRQLTALVLTLVVAGSVVGGGFLYAAWMATRYIIDQIQDDSDMVEVVMEDPGMDDALPPPPPPPPPPAASTPEPDDEDVQQNPDEMSEDIKQLDEKVEDKVKNDKGGQEGGQEGGVVGGVEGGVVGGVVGGVIGGQLGGVRVFHHSEVKVKRRVQPRYPDAAQDLHLGAVICRVNVFIDEKGVPYDIEPQNCPKVFHQEVKDALYKWRWYPAKVERKAVKGQFLMAIKFVP